MKGTDSSGRKKSHALIREIRVTLVLFLIAAGFLITTESFDLAKKTDASLDAQVNVLQTPLTEYLADDSDIAIMVHDDAERAVTAGQKDARLLSFTLSSRKAAKVQRMNFSLGTLAEPTDLQTLQLFIDGEFVVERPFFEGKGSFDDLHLRLYPHRDVRVDVTGSVHEDASVGHRLKLGFVEENDLIIRSIASEPLESGLTFPVWGPAVSIIGQRL